jgi:Ice-binding-like
MSNRIRPRRRRRAGIAVVAVLALGIVPAAAQASAVNLGKVSPFVVLGGSGVTNEGTSTLNGDLGVSPQTSLTGFGSPTVVNGVIHDDDAVAAEAQGDLGIAYGVAGLQPVSLGNELTGKDLGGLTLTPGAYGYSTSAQLTGQVTLDAQGDPNAQFVFIIGTTLTTASASSVNLVNGASPCNVFWRVGSSATLGSHTEFQGNVMAHASISVNEDVSVLGRVLAQEGAVTLINDTLDNSMCTAGGGSETETETAVPTSPVVTPTTGPVVPTTTKKAPVVEKAHGPKVHKAARNGSSTVTHGAQGPNGTTVIVSGHAIQKIVVSVDNKKVGSSTKERMKTNVNGAPGTHKVTVEITYKDHTPGETTTFHFHVPSPAPLHPHHGPSQFTG